MRENPHNIFFVNSKSDIFTISIYFPVGSIHEPKGQSGISHFLEHIKFHNKDVYKKLASEAIDYNAYTHEDHTMYFIKSHIADYKRIIDLLLTLSLKTEFKKSSVNTERQIVLNEIMSYIYEDKYNHSPTDFHAQKDASILHPDNPYYRSIGGTLEDINNITYSQLKSYDEKYYKKSFIIIVNCPAKYNKRVYDYIEKKFPKPATNLLYNPITKQSKITNLQKFKYRLNIIALPDLPPELKPKVPSSSIIMVFKAFAGTQRESWLMDFVKRTLFGEISSVINNTIRVDKGYTYGIKSNVEIARYYGNISILISTINKKNITDVISTLFEELTLLKQGKHKKLTKSAYTKYKRDYLKDMKILIDSGNFISQSNLLKFYNSADYTTKAHIKDIRDLTYDDFTKLLNEVFNYNKMSLTCILGNEATNSVKKRIINILNNNRELFKNANKLCNVKSTIQKETK